MADQKPKKARKPFRAGTDAQHQMNTTPSKRHSNYKGTTCGANGKSTLHPKGCRVTGSQSHKEKAERKANAKARKDRKAKG